MQEILGLKVFTCRYCFRKSAEDMSDTEIIQNKENEPSEAVFTIGSSLELTPLDKRTVFLICQTRPRGETSGCQQGFIRAA